ncbi:MAG: CvpA family protein [Chitinophagaceae bacterium]|jgi:membrane protein required for colicin V production
MTIDIIALILLILLFVRGYKKGIIVALCSVIAVLLGLTCALALSAKLAVYMQDKGYASSAWAPILSYVILFIGVVWLVRLLAKLIDGFTSTILLGWVNKSIGGILYAALGMVIYSSLLWLANYAHLISPETIVASKTYKHLEPIAPWTFEHMGKVLPFAKDSFTDMREFFDGVNQKLPEHVGTHR